MNAAVRQATLCAAFQATAAAHPDCPALRAFGSTEALTWGQYAARVRSIAGGLAALGTGHGSTVALMLSHRPEAHLVDTAALHLGAVPFSLDPQSSTDQIGFLLDNSDATVLVTEQALLTNAQDALRMVSPVPRVIVVDREPASGDGSLSLAEIESESSAGFDFEAAWRGVDAEDLATIVYTSGTTGVPKGVQLPHRVMMSSLRGVQDVAPPRHGSRVLAYLPMAHIAERFWSHYAAMAFGFEIVGVAPAGRLESALVTERPDRFFAVPRTYEKLAAAARRMIEADPLLEQAAAAQATEWSDQAHETLAPVREGLGLQRTDWRGVATAPSSPGVLDLFAAIGLPVANMWGLTEAVMATLTPPGAPRPGTVGRALPEVELRIADDGELLIRGPNLFVGYRKDPERTRETLDPDGWVHTGDLGSIDSDGYCRIVGRKKEIMITSGGKNLAPAAIESVLKEASPLIAYAATVADGRKYVTALLALDPDELAAYAAERRLGGPFANLVRSAEVAGEIERAVDTANQRLGHVEQVKRYCLMDAPWIPGGDEVTTTLKLRRSLIETKFRDVVEGLYA